MFNLRIPSNSIFFHPHAMSKLLAYGYSYVVRGSRKLEKACHRNPSFMWLTSGLKSDHKTIAKFRRSNKSALPKVLKQCAIIFMYCTPLTVSVNFGGVVRKRKE